MTFEVKYDLTFELAVLQAEEYFYKAILRRWIWILIGLITCTIVSYISYTITGQYFIFAFFIGVITSFFFGFYLVYIQTVNRARILTEVSDSPEIEFIVTDDNIVLKSKMSWQIINWSKVHRYIESENMIFLISPTRPIGIPKIHFNEDEKHFIRTKVSAAVIANSNLHKN